VSGHGRVPGGKTVENVRVIVHAIMASRVVPKVCCVSVRRFCEVSFMDKRVIAMAVSAIINMPNIASRAKPWFLYGVRA
jgi:hypothetical protein